MSCRKAFNYLYHPAPIFPKSKHSMQNLHAATFLPFTQTNIFTHFADKSVDKNIRLHGDSGLRLRSQYFALLLSSSALHSGAYKSGPSFISKNESNAFSTQMWEAMRCSRVFFALIKFVAYKWVLYVGKCGDGK